MKTSESIDKIAPAFVKAQAEFGKAVKDSANPFFKSKYADLNSYLDGCSEGLRNNGLAIMQDTSGSEASQMISVTTRLIHESGQWFESEPLILHPTDMKPQSFGSAQTYGRRYSIASFLCLGAEDDDGNQASKTPKKDPEKKPEPPKAVEAQNTDVPNFPAISKAFSLCTTMTGLEEKANKLESKYGPNIWSRLTGNDVQTYSDLYEENETRILGGE